MKQPHFPQPSFLPCLDTQIEEHLSDTSLNVKKLLRLVGMSRTDLHRKLHDTVGMSTTEYVRNVRLQRAARLLRAEQEWSVCQVAEEVGFNSQGYFARRFREAFGCCPCKYRDYNLVGDASNFPEKYQAQMGDFPLETEPLMIH